MPSLQPGDYININTTFTYTPLLARYYRCCQDISDHNDQNRLDAIGLSMSKFNLAAVLWSNNRGATAVEVGIIAPVFFGLIVHLSFVLGPLAGRQSALRRGRRRTLRLRPNLIHPTMQERERSRRLCDKSLSWAEFAQTHLHLCRCRLRQFRECFSELRDESGSEER